VIHEFAAAAQDYPIVFIKDADTGRFNAVALLGLKAGENLFYHERAWQGMHRPEEYGCFPFTLRVHSDRAEEGLLCIDRNAPIVNEHEGERLFDNDGEQTPFLKSMARRLTDLASKKVVTTQFIATLLDKKLLTASTLQINLSNENYQLTGIYAIDENALNAMSDQDFCQLKAKGYLVPVYASLLSLQNVQRMIRMKSGADSYDR